tara:strand:- start:799 stop:1365 length:567 start_codon:yes stop_codon:yes gene_type:complete
MGKQTYDVALTRYQSISLILIEYLGCSGLVTLLIHILKDYELEDARTEHLEMREDVKFMNTGIPLSCPVPMPCIRRRQMNDVLFDVQCLRPGFMKIFIPSDENNDWYWIYERPYNLEEISGMIEMDLLNKLYTIETLRREYSVNADKLNDVNYSLDGFFRQMNHGKKINDYGGIYYKITDEEKRPVIL